MKKIQQILGPANLKAFQWGRNFLKGNDEMKEQICLFHEQNQTHFPTAFDLEWLKLILLKTLVETEFSSQGTDSSKIKRAKKKGKPTSEEKEYVGRRPWAL